MKSAKDSELDLNKHDLRSEMSGGMPGGATKCNFVGQPPATHAEGPSVTAPEVGVHATGQGTHQ
jgi:hypothetical protein